MKYSSVKVCSKQQLITVQITSDEKPTISDVMVKKWQGILDLLSSTINVPAALIMRIEERHIEVLLKSNNSDNPYIVGEKAELHCGLYCETVIGNTRLAYMCLMH
jgi:two-component system, sensor histidine kinase and response regulator